MSTKRLRDSYKLSGRWTKVQCQSYSTKTDVKPFNEIPGLSSLPIIGSLHHFLPVIGSIGPKANFFDLIENLHQKYGSIVRMAAFARSNMVILYEPQHYEYIYRSEEVNPTRPGFETLVLYREEIEKEKFDGVYGLMTAQGAKWREFRTKVNPALLKPQLVKLYEAPLSEIADEVVLRLVKTQEDGDYLKNNFDLEMTKWSLESIGLVGLGTRLGCLKDDITDDHPARQLMKCAKDIMDLTYQLEFLPSLWKIMPTPDYKKVMKTYDLQWELSQIYIQQAKNKLNDRGHVPEEDKSIIEKLLAIDEKVAVMMANEMLLAGIDTASFVMTGLLYHLALHPHVQKKLREEIRSDPTSRRYVRACLKESLRIWPVVQANLRRTTKEYTIAGYHIPEGIDVIAPNEYLSRSEKYYPKPNEYIPERWLAEKTDPLYYGHAHPMVTLPFGFGVRMCIGRRIAELEIDILAKKIVKDYNVIWDGPPIKVVTRLINAFQKPYYFKFERV